jgi:hypothetical protein
VHGAVPVAGSAELAELAEDDAAVLVAPCGRDLDELLAAEVVARPAFFLAELLLDAGLRGDAGVVGADLPSWRARRTMMSCSVLLSRCPMCSTPVTLGGGIITAKDSREWSTLPWKQPAATQRSYHCCSTPCGS